MAAPPGGHPIRLVVDDDLGRSRLTVFFRLLLAVPHLLWLVLVGIVVLVLVVVNWFATLFRGRSPGGLHDFIAGYIRYATHVFAYLFLAANPFPAFFVGGHLDAYPIDVEIAPPAPQNRWVTGFRLFLGLPALMMAGVLSGGGGSSGGRSSGGVAGVAAFLSWWSALARGRSPRGLRDLLAWALGYGAQTYAYLALLTDRYPSSDPLPFLASLAPPDAPDRAKLVNTDDLRRSRLTVFFRLPLAFPHIAWLLLWTVAAILAGIANWFATLATGRSPTPLFRFLSAYVRYSTHVSAFLFLIGNPFPGFAGRAGSYPVDVRIEPADRQKRMITLFRIFLTLPAAMLSGALGSVTFLVGIFGWFVGLALGRMPASLQRAGAVTLGYSAQVSCYGYALTDRYPHSSPLAVLEPR
jgi:hypothetical protein